MARKKSVPKKPPAPAEPVLTGPVDIPPMPAHVASRWERYDVIRIDRSLIRNAPYNPRVMNKAEKRKLQTILEKLGLLEPLVWNRRSGNLVAGHQRLSILDVLEGSKDYSLLIAVVDLTPKQEREANIALNNSNAQGSYDFDKLAAMFQGTGDEKLDYEATGFDTGDMYAIFGEGAVTDLAKGAEDLEAMADNIRHLREMHDKVKSAIRDRDDIKFYSVIVFGSVEERNAFWEKFGLVEDPEYIDARFLESILELPPERREPQEAAP